VRRSRRRAAAPRNRPSRRQASPPPLSIAWRGELDPGMSALTPNVPAPPPCIAGRGMGEEVRLRPANPPGRARECGPHPPPLSIAWRGELDPGMSAQAPNVPAPPPCIAGRGVGGEVRVRPASPPGRAREWGPHPRPLSIAWRGELDPGMSAQAPNVPAPPPCIAGRGMGGEVQVRPASPPGRAQECGSRGACGSRGGGSCASRARCGRAGRRCPGPRCRRSGTARWPGPPAP
jgi:hypothetical protein